MSRIEFFYQNGYVYLVVGPYYHSADVNVRPTIVLIDVTDALNPVEQARFAYETVDFSGYKVQKEVIIINLFNL